MDQPHSHYALWADWPPTSVSMTTPLSDSVSSTEAAAEAVPGRQVAVPAAGVVPGFDNVFSLALTAALFDQAVLVICMTDEAMMGWQQRLAERGRPVEGLTLLDGRFAWSVNWRAFFRMKCYDITVLHGIHAALADQTVPRSYADRLVDAVPAGLIVLA